MADQDLHPRPLRARRLLRRRTCRQPARALAGPLVRAARPGRGRAALRPAGAALRPGGPRPRRARGDVRRRPPRRPDRARRSRWSRRSPPRCASAAADRSAARGRSCRSARRSAPRWAGCVRGRRGPDAGAGRLRRGRRHRGDVQRPAGRGVLRDGADPARLRRRVVRHGGARLGDRERRSAAPRSATSPSCTCPPSPSTHLVGVPALRRCSGCSPGRSASASPASCTRSRTSATRPGADRSGCARPSADSLLGVVLLVLPQMYGVGYPVLEHAVGGQYAIGFLLVLLVGKMVATSLTIGIGGSGGVFAPEPVHRRHARLGLRRRGASPAAGRRRARRCLRR